jgi:hypothetical protein
MMNAVRIGLAGIERWQEHGYARAAILFRIDG